MTQTTNPDQMQALITAMARMAHMHRVPLDDPNALDFFASNWANCADGLLKRTTRIRVTPEPSPAPTMFEFEIDTPYKRKLGDGPVELMPGPIRGRIIYRPDMFDDPSGPTIAVLIDPQLGYFHPNHNKDHNVLCIGDETNLPDGPLHLDQLLESHLFPILSYQNRRPTHPANAEAARFFALDPTAMEGLEPVDPLY